MAAEAPPTPTVAMDFLLKHTPELLPASGVIHSNNAKVYLAGFELLRVQDFNCRFSNSIGQFAECGRNQTIPFPAHVRVTGSMRRAFVNGAEWRIGLGVAASVHPVGVPLTSDVMDDLIALKSVGGFPAGNNTYPLKCDIEAHLGADPLLPSETLAQFGTQLMRRVCVVKGVIIDALAINFNADGLVTSGPIEFIAEAGYFRLDLITAVTPVPPPA